jgi:hypothetical protein
VDPINVDIRLIRAVLGAELRVAPGRALMARVVSVYPGGRGALSIAGALIDAQLPKGVEAGQDLSLVVRHVSPERVVLGMAGDQTATPAPVPPPAAQLPGGGTVQVTERDAGGAGGGSGRAGDRHALALVYDAPALGAVDLRFELDSGALRLTATLAAGEPVARARDAAGELRDALSEALGRPATVEIGARREPLDVYA